MWECDASVQARTAEPFAFDKLGKYFFSGDIWILARQQLAQNLEAVFLATRRDVTQHAVPVDKLFKIQWHGSGEKQRGVDRYGHCRRVRACRESSLTVRPL